MSALPRDPETCADEPVAGKFVFSPTGEKIYLRKREPVAEGAPGPVAISPMRTDKGPGVAIEAGGEKVVVLLVDIADTVDRLRDIEGMTSAYEAGQEAKRLGADSYSNPFLSEDAVKYAFQCGEWSKGWRGDGFGFFDYAAVEKWRREHPRPDDIGDSGNSLVDEEGLQALSKSITAGAREDPAIPEPDRPWRLQMLIDGMRKCDPSASVTVRGGLSPGSFGSLRSASPGNVAFFGFDRGRVSVRSVLASAEIMASAATLGGLPEDALVFYTQGVELNIGVVGLHVQANGDVTIQTKDFG